jgi:hypothetical protein
MASYTRAAQSTEALRIIRCGGSHQQTTGRLIDAAGASAVALAEGVGHHKMNTGGVYSGRKRGKRGVTSTHHSRYKPGLANSIKTGWTKQVASE